MCDDSSVCPLSREQFVAAINKGSFPFSSAGNKSKYEQNIEDVGRYLLGYPPLGSNTSVTLPLAVRAGNGYGQYVTIRHKDRKAPYLDHAGDPPQFVANDKGTELTISAPIDKGGVYPLRVSNSGKPTGVTVAGAPDPSYPAFLEINPGPQLLYTLDNGDPVYRNGSQRMLFAPIHDVVGIQLLRIVALAPQQGETFSANVGFVDLSGDWLPKSEAFQVTKIHSMCEGQDASALKTDPIVLLLAALGAFRPTPVDKEWPSLKWVADESFPDNSPVVLNADVDVGTDAVKLVYRLELAKPKSGLDLPGILPAVQGREPIELWAWAWLLPALGLVIKGQQWKGRLAILAALALLLPLAGCDFVGILGDLRFYGDLRGEYTFEKLEYADPDYNHDRTSREIWYLDGVGALNWDLALISEDDASDHSLCTASIEVKAKMIIQEDGHFTIEDFESAM